MERDDFMPSKKWVKTRQKIARSLYKHSEKVFDFKKLAMGTEVDTVLALVAKDVNISIEELSRFLLVDNIMTTVVLEMEV